MDLTPVCFEKHNVLSTVQHPANRLSMNYRKPCTFASIIPVTWRRVSLLYGYPRKYPSTTFNHQMAIVGVEGDRRMRTCVVQKIMGWADQARHNEDDKY